MSVAKSITETSPFPGYDSLFENCSSYVGVLLYGFPGCGKSLLIKGLSAECGLPCLVVSPSILLRKYVGETNQQCRSLFSLAQKLSPCILCIDEVDGLFRERSEWEHDVTRDLKCDFMQYLDGIAGVSDSSEGRKILVAATTNRPFDVDSAILRRLSRSFFVDLPDFAGRELILRHWLRSVPKDPNLDVAHLSMETEGYSPSDLKQLLQVAATTGPLRESGLHSRPISTHHVLYAMKVVSPTPLSSKYRMALSKFVQLQGPQRRLPSSVGQASTPKHADGENHFIWETDYGNFYNLGSLEIDPNTFDRLTDLIRSFVEFEDDSDDEGEGV